MERKTKHQKLCFTFQFDFCFSQKILDKTENVLVSDLSSDFLSKFLKLVEETMNEEQ